MNNKKYILILICLFIFLIIFFPKKQMVLVNSNDLNSFYADSVYDGISLEQKYKSDKNYDGLYNVIKTFNYIHVINYIADERINNLYMKR